VSAAIAKHNPPQRRNQPQAGAAGVHFEDQLASAKKCGHLGGKVLVPTKEFVAKLQVSTSFGALFDFVWGWSARFWVAGMGG